MQMKLGKYLPTLEAELKGAAIYGAGAMLPAQNFKSGGRSQSYVLCCILNEIPTNALNAACGSR